MMKAAKCKMYLDKNYIISEIGEHLSDDIISWAYDFVKDDMLYREDSFYGIVHNIHITLLSDVIESEKNIKEVLSELKPFTCTLGLIKKFTTNSKFDVLYIEVKSTNIHDINKKLASQIRNESFYKNYTPHVTICYLKKDCCENLCDNNYFMDREFCVKELTYSTPDVKTIIRLDEK